MPDKATFEKIAGKYCAEQAEIARPKIEQIVKDAADMDDVVVKPHKLETMTIGAWGKYGGRFGWPDITPREADFDESFADCMIRLVKEVIEGVRNGCLT